MAGMAFGLVQCFSRSLNEGGKRLSWSFMSGSGWVSFEIFPIVHGSSFLFSWVSLSRPSLS